MPEQTAAPGKSVSPGAAVCFLILFFSKGGIVTVAHTNVLWYTKRNVIKKMPGDIWALVGVDYEGKIQEGAA